MYMIQTNNIGKLILHNRQVLPLGDYICPEKVRSLIGVIDIQACTNAFLVATSSFVYIFNTTKCIQTSYTRYTCLTNYIIVNNNTTCNIYDDNLTDIAANLPIQMNLNKDCSVYNAGNYRIMKHHNSYWYTDAPDTYPVKITDKTIQYDNDFTYSLVINSITHIYPSSCGIFIIQQGTQLLLFDKSIETNFAKSIETACYSMWLSKLLSKFKFTNQMQIYPTKTQFIVVDNKKIYVFPLEENVCITREEYAEQIIKANFVIQPNPTIITINDKVQMSRETNGDIRIYNWTDNLGGVGNILLPEKSNQTITTMDSGCLIDNTNYYEIIVSFSIDSFTDQQYLNYIYTSSVIAKLIKKPFVDYLSKRMEWIQLQAKYPITCSSFDKFIKMVVYKTYNQLQVFMKTFK